MTAASNPMAWDPTTGQMMLGFVASMEFTIGARFPPEVGINGLAVDNLSSILLHHGCIGSVSGGAVRNSQTGKGDPELGDGNTERLGKLKRTFNVHVVPTDGATTLAHSPGIRGTKCGNEPSPKVRDLMSGGKGGRCLLRSLLLRPGRWRKHLGVQ